MEDKHRIWGFGFAMFKAGLHITKCINCAQENQGLDDIMYALIVKSLKDIGLHMSDVRKVLAHSCRRNDRKRDAEMLATVSDSDLLSGNWKYTCCHNMMDIIEGLRNHFVLISV